MSGGSNQEALKIAVKSLSEDKNNWNNARKEWILESVDDNEDCTSVCTCGQHGLRWEYYIRNIHNKNQIMIGSSCIKHFQNNDLTKYSKLFEKSDKKIEYWKSVGKYTYRGLHKNTKFYNWWMNTYPNKYLNSAHQRNRRDEMLEYYGFLETYLK